MPAPGRVVQAADGRALRVSEWGDRDGFPVFGMHGTPGGRLDRHPDESVYVAAGMRAITYDRPGYGGSDRLPGRTVVDCVGDVLAIADALGIDSFSVAGGSGGGPHALAVAARLPDRVLRAGCNVGIVPFDAPGIDWFAGMDPLNVREFGWAVEGEATLVPQLERELAAMGVRVAEDPSNVLGEEWALSDEDRAALSRPDLAQQIRDSIEELVDGGVWGWVDDDLAFVRPWGFDLDEVTVPVQVRYGVHDVLVPAAHGAWLGANVPGASVVAEEGYGHLGSPEKDDAADIERYRWLVTGI